MLCYRHHTTGEICTNRCNDRQTCTQKRIPFLIEAADRLASEAHFNEVQGLKIIEYNTYCISPEGYINGVINDLDNNNDELLLS